MLSHSKKNIDSKSIPFTYAYNRDVENIILDYVHPADLKQYSEARQMDLNTLAFIQIPAKEKINPSYQVLLVNLVSTISMLHPEEKIYMPAEQSYQIAYENLCNQMKDKLLDALKRIDQDKKPIDIKLIRDMVLHYCHNNNEASGKFLHTLIFSPNKTDLVNLLITNGATLDLGTLSLAIGSGFPLDTIKLIWSESKHSHFGLVSPLILAAYHPDPNVLNFALQNFNTHEDRVFKILLSDEKDSYIVGYSYDQKQLQDAPLKFFKAAKHANLSKENILLYLKHQLSLGTTPADWKKIYDEHIRETYLNATTTASIFFLFKKRYEPIKITFIEDIQQRLYEYLTHMDTLKKFIDEKNIPAYYQECRDILDSEIFSKSHEQYGINPAFRHKLELRIQEIDQTFKCVI